MGLQTPEGDTIPARTLGQPPALPTRLKADGFPPQFGPAAK
jgi:hypothetical protein